MSYFDSKYDLCQALIKYFILTDPNSKSNNVVQKIVITNWYQLTPNGLKLTCKHFLGEQSCP